MSALALASFSFKESASLVRRAFPGATSRRPVRVYVTETYACRDFWDGGSREEPRFVELATGRVLSSDSIPRAARQQAGNGYGLAVADVALTPGFAIVVHSIFCGKDLGYRVYVCAERARELAGASGGYHALLTK
jgi:hypothetical protein